MWRTKLKKITFYLFLLAITVFFAGLCADILYPLPLKIKYSRVVLSSEGQVMHTFLSTDEKWRLYCPFEQTSPDLVKAVLHKEDKYFYRHFGINPFSVINSLINNILEGKKTSGASTITMQVARLLEPKPRTYSNKIIEMLRAIQLEIHLSKSEILELYLNLVPYAGNIEGIKAASLLYFGTYPDRLSLAQAVTLAIVPNRPTSLGLGKNNALIEKERNRWIAKFKKSQLFDNQLIEDALLEPLEAFRRPSPKEAPHLSRRVLAMSSPEYSYIKTTLKAGIQQKVAEITASYSKKLHRFNIFNAAVIVVDNHHHRIVAYLGSPDFDDRLNSGQVDGVQAVRSPGSALKPFVYGLAFDRGIATPKQVVYDVPTVFETYAPQNFDRKFNGKLSISSALAASLNVPAVKTLEQIGVQDFTWALKNVGFSHLARNEQHLGLSLALGGCGVTLKEMAGLYCAFANGGRYQPLRLLADASPDTAHYQMLSPSATYMITEILTKIERPDLPNNFENSRNLPKVAWKTGTSYARKDAWSIGYNSRYTIGVWVGNFNGEGAPELQGSQIATPLLFKLFDAIDYAAPADWFSPPEELRFRLVCSESGLVPSAFCENQITDYFIPQVSHNQKCTHLKYIFVSADEKQAYCTHCLPEAGYKKVLLPNLASELIAFYEAEHIPYPKIPPHNSLCSKIFSDNPPKITSPQTDREFLVGKEETELMLACQTTGDVFEVYWYINDQFYQKAKATEKIFFKPPKGNIKISCSDDKGRNTNIWIKVK